MLLILLLAAASALTNKIDINSRNFKRTLAMIDTHPFGNFFLDVVALQVRSGDSIDNIISLIDEIVDDILDQQDEADSDYSQTNETCESQISQLSSDIQSSQNILDQATADLEDNLLPELDQLQDTYSDLQNKLQTNLENQAEAYNEEGIDYDNYVQKAQDFSDAIAACDQALQLLETLVNQPAGSTSLIQAKSLNKAMESIAQRYKRMHSKSKFGPMITALVEITASQNFVDQDTLNDVIDLIEDLRQEFIDDQASALEWEDTSEANYNNYLASLQADFNSTTDQIASTAQSILSTTSDIEVANYTIQYETAAVESGQASLTQLEAYCETAYANYQSTSASYSDQLEILAEVREIFVELEDEISDYLRSRIESELDQDE